MASSGYASWSVIASEQPTVAKWNLLGSNDASFNNGQGFNDGIIVQRHLAGGIQPTIVEKNPYKFSAYAGSNQTITNATPTKVQLNTELFDTSSNFDSVNNYRFTTPISGFYFLTGAAYISNMNPGVGISYFYKNGSLALQSGPVYTTGGNDAQSVCSGLIQLSVNDYIELFVYQSSGGSKTLSGTSNQTYLMGFLVSVL